MSDALKRLDEIEGRVKAATPGPWKVEAGGEAIGQECFPYETVVGIDEHHTYTGSTFKWLFKPEDRELVANAPADLALLARLVRSVAEAECECNMYANTTAICWRCWMCLELAGGVR